MSTRTSPALPRREVLPQRFPLCKVVRMMRLQTSDLKVRSICAASALFPVP